MGGGDDGDATFRQDVDKFVEKVGHKLGKACGLLDDHRCRREIRISTSTKKADPKVGPG